MRDVGVGAPVPESEGGPVHVHRQREEVVVERQVLALPPRGAGAEGDGGDGPGGEHGGGVAAVGDARDVGLDVVVRGEGHAGPEGVRVGAAGEAEPPEVLGGGVLVEDPPQRLPLDGGGVPRQPLELGDHLLAAELALLLPRHHRRLYPYRVLPL